jgi:enamine deaminase RidA (YjgF/YER057c/UK114 family)
VPRSIHIPGAEHGAPIPNGSIVGNVVFSSLLSGYDPKTREWPEDAATQATNLFKHIRTLLEHAGGTVDDIGHISFKMKEDSYREAINVEWLKMFPDENRRPARHALKTSLRGKALFQAELIAVLGASSGGVS